MPSMTADDDHPFDPRATCIGMGIVAQTFWQLPGVLRAATARTLAAAGLQAAARITAPHPVDVLHGLTARLAGYMNWMGRCCCSAWITPPILPSTWARRRARYRRKKYVTLLKEGRLSGSITPRLITAARTSALSMAGWKAIAPRARWAREARLVRSSDVIRWSRKNSTERDRLSPSLRRG